MTHVIRAGKSYFYRKVWRDGTCVSEYLGSGYLGALIERLEQQERWQRQAEAEALRQQQAQEEAIDRQIDAYFAQVKAVVAASLLAAGYHTHKRQWRKARKMSKAMETMAPSITPGPADDKAAWADLIDLLKAIKKNKPTERQMVELRAFFDQHPFVCAEVSTLAHSVTTVLCKQAYVEEHTQLLMEAEVRGAKYRLGYLHASDMERLLIDQVAIAWVRLQFVEQLYSLNTHGEQGYHAKRVEHWEHRLDAAQKRYLRAMETLTRIRKMGPNVLQVNIAQQQIITQQLT